jgi:Kef-type K+ transport system membrane component KefB
VPVFVLIMHLETANEILNEVWVTGLSLAAATRQALPAGDLSSGGVAAQLDAILSGPAGPSHAVIGIALWLFSKLGVLFLLFMVGLESSVAEMRRLGARPAYVAVVGVVMPFMLGYLATTLLLPEAPASVHLFVAATLCATSVGITARVFRDLDRLRTPEAGIILGAAVIDDVLGLIVLAVVVGIVITGTVHLSEILRISALSLLFFGVVVLVGERLASRGVGLFRALDRPTYTLLYPVLLTLVLAWAASMIGLAAIVGAFAAGLIVSEEQFARGGDGGRSVRELVAPLEMFLAPVFFVLMGMQVDLAAFLRPEVLAMIALLVAAAALGKLASGLVAGRGRDRLSVGVGMVPRGEVGLIFASVGKGLGVVGDDLFSAIVIMVIVTTLITPPALRWSFARSDRLRRTPAGGRPAEEDSQVSGPIVEP